MNFVEFKDLKTDPIRWNIFNMSMMDSDIKINNIYLERNGQPVLPIMGEFQFSRYPDECWEKEILKMKADGINIIATYLFWIHHERKEGCWDFSGSNNLRKFTELCKKHSMMVILRVGPWVHGEARNGGLPDYIRYSLHKRSNHPKYLAKVRELFEKYYEQSKDSFYDGKGGVIGIQLDNELYDKHNHIEKLREIAIDVGFKLPIYTKTGWPMAKVTDTVLPLFGCYADAPWDSRLTRISMADKYHFKLVRGDGNIGTDIIKNRDDNKVDYYDFPNGTCELGCGMHSTHHRRPIISSMDAYALSFVHLGSGSNLVGYYPYHGGRNPLGALYQESRRTFYPNNLPIVSYDFQAAIGEFGAYSERHKYLRLLHYFANDFGDIAAPMQTKLLPGANNEIKDDITKKMCIRVDEKQRGFLFLNTYQRFTSFAPIEKTDVRIGDVTIPDVSLESGKCVFYAFNFDAGDINFRYVKAQLLCKFRNGSKDCYVFFTDSDKVEFSTADKITTCAKALGNNRYVYSMKEEIVPAVETEKTAVYFISQNRALKVFKPCVGSDYLLFSEDDIYCDDKRVYLSHSNGKPKSVIGVLGSFKPAGYDFAGQAGELKIYKKIFPENSYQFSLAQVKGSRKKWEHYLFSFRKKTEYGALFISDFGEAQDIEIEFLFKGDVLQMYAGDLLIYDKYNLDEKVKIRLSTLMKYMNDKPVRIRLSQLSSIRPIYTEYPLERNKAELKVNSITPIYEISIS